MKRNEAVFLQVLNSQLEAIVSEMAENILQAAHSTFIKETWDIASLLVTPEGEAFACPREIAAKRIGMNLGPALKYIAEEGPGAIRPGDIFISNDPQTTGGLATHLNDVFLWKPVFWEDRLVCCALVFIHVSDVGGMVPGSLSPAATEIFQEGLRLPPTLIYRDGQVSRQIRALIMNNTRVAPQVWGDIAAAIGALNVCEGRLKALSSLYSADEFSKGTSALLTLAEERARALIGLIPNGSYSFDDYIDGLPNLDPIRLVLTLHVADDTVTMDFSGSDPEVAAAYNLYSYSQDGHWGLTRALSDYFLSVDPAVPWNSGLVRPILVDAPHGSVLNPTDDVACGMRVATYFRIYYMVLGALAKALPGMMPASGPASTGVMVISTNDPVTGERRINVGQALFGGSGGRPKDDGFDGNEMVSWYLRNVPVEILEQEIAVRFLSYGIASGTGGAGRYRGGHGTRVSLQFLTPARVAIRGLQRYEFRAWGVDGGAAGAKGEVVINEGRPDMRRVDVVTVLDLDRNDVLTLVSPGGGGFGNPFMRDAARVAEDVANGLLDARLARRDYGVALQADGTVDAAETERLRQRRPAAAGSIDLGPEREEFDRWWPAPLYEAMGARIEGCKPAERRVLVNRMRAFIRERARQGVATSVAELDAAVTPEPIAQGGA